MSKTTARISDADFDRIKAQLDAYHEAHAKRRVIVDAEIERLEQANIAAGKKGSAIYTEAERKAAYALADSLVPVPTVEIHAFHHPLRGAFYREQRRRQANATRAANASKRTARAVQTGTYAVGEAVEVHAFGRWYRGTVTKVGRTGKVFVEFTSGAGTTRVKAVDSTKIRKLG